MAEAAYENDGTSSDVPSALRDIVQTYGRVVLQDQPRIEELLRGVCGSHVREVNVLLLALKENIPADLIAPQTDGQPRPSLLTRLTARLEDTYGTAPETARWAVETWDFASGFRAQAVSSPASQAQSTASVKPNAARPAVTPQERAAASAALIALWTGSDGHFDSAKAETVTAEQIQQLLDRGADVNVKNHYGRTALMDAARSGCSDCVALLIAHGADVNAKLNNGHPVLSMAASSGHSACVTVLIAHGADVNAKNNDGHTALMDAAWSGRADCVIVLIAHGADVNAKGNHGPTALWGADCHGCSDCVTILKAAGAIG